MNILSIFTSNEEDKKFNCPYCETPLNIEMEVLEDWRFRTKAPCCNNLINVKISEKEVKKGITEITYKARMVSVLKYR